MPHILNVAGFRKVNTDSAGFRMEEFFIYPRRNTCLDEPAMGLFEIMTWDPDGCDTSKTQCQIVFDPRRPPAPDTQCCGKKKTCVRFKYFVGFGVGRVCGFRPWQIRVAP